MKYSDYNTILPLSDKLALIYSGVSDLFVIFRKELLTLLETVSADELSEKAPYLYSELIKSGSIIQNNEDELAKIIQLNREILLSDKSYRLIINPTIDCNFNCWYCYENHIVGSKMQQETIQKVRLLISNIIATHPKLEMLEVSFFGGEPLLYYNEVVRNIIDYCREECKQNQISLSIGFTSNGYLLNEDIISHLSIGDELKSFQITLDGNRDIHNKIRFPQRGKMSYDKILSNISLLLENNIEVILRINYTAKTILSIKDVLEDIKSIKADKRKLLTISFHRVWQDIRRTDLPDVVVDDIVKHFRNEFVNVTDAYSMNNLRYPCYADRYNEAVINYDGNVFKCTARDFFEENRLGILKENGNIEWTQDIRLRINSKIKNSICYKCRLLPLCGGGCIQKSIESGKENICIEGLTNSDMDRVVMQRFYDSFVR